MTESNIYNNKVLNIIIPIVLLFAGLYFVPITLFNYDFSKIPGDLGDARFNNYILEHGYQYLTGKIDSYWQGQFMYPYHNVIALSDNLLGTVPIYSLFRSIGIDRETSFQYWFVALFALNYIFCYWALKKWSGHTILSAVGAYIYAFGLYNHGEIFHAQVFPRFIAPMVFYWSWKFIKEKESKFLMYSLLGLIYQFYCGVYLGFLLLYVLMFFLIAYLIVYRDQDLFKQYSSRKIIFNHLGIVLVAVIVFLPLIIPYYEVSKITGVRSFDAAFNSIPRIQSYFFTSPASVTWSFLYPLSAYSFPDWWNHFLFTGILAWTGVVLFPFVLLSKETTKPNKRFVGFVFIGFTLSFIFCLNINGFTFYKLIYQIPGFSSMRSLDRIINTQVIFLILLFVFVFKSISSVSSKFRVLVLFLPLLVIIDNLIEPEPHKSFFKSDAQNEVNFVKEKIKSNLKNNIKAVAYIPIDLILAENDRRGNEAVSQTLSTMIACQELNVICVNGYSGFNPGNFEQFFLNPGAGTLKDWCDFNNCEISTIQIINETSEDVLEWRSVNIKSANFKYLCADEGLDNKIAANKDHAFSWETFKMVKLTNQKCVFQSHRIKYFGLSSDSTNSIAATNSKISQNEIFTIVKTSSDETTLKAANGKYLIVDPNDNKIKASGDNIQIAEKFIITDFIESK